MTKRTGKGNWFCYRMDYWCLWKKTNKQTLVCQANRLEFKSSCQHNRLYDKLTISKNSVHSWQHKHNKLKAVKYIDIEQVLKSGFVLQCCWSTLIYYFLVIGWKEGRKCFLNDPLNTFYLRLYVVEHMIKGYSDNERGNCCSHYMSYSFR